MVGKNNSGMREHNKTPELQISPETFFHVQRSIAAIKSIWTRIADTNKTQIEMYFAEDIPDILQFDTMKVQYCLNNLVENAVTNTKNGLVRIIVSNLKGKSGRTFLSLSVMDTGPGISPITMTTLFHPNVSALAKHKPAFGFIDTSLAMTQSLAAELGGKILVKSTLGIGSIFTLLLPLGTEIPILEKETNQANILKTNEFPDLNILVVDDYNLNQLTIQTLLHDQVNRVYTASHGYEALEILNSCPVDIVLMDIHMPILDGIETTLKIRDSEHKWSNTHIVAMTADPQYQYMGLCRKIGMDDTLSKPFRKDDLMRVLTEYATPYKLAIAE